MFLRHAFLLTKRGELAKRPDGTDERVVMGKFSRDKGNRVERRMVNMLNEAHIPARRVPLSGATDYAKGDIEFQKPGAVDVRDGAVSWPGNALVAECKARKEFPKWLTEYLGSNDALFLVEDRKEPLVVLPFSIFRKIIE